MKRVVGIIIIVLLVLSVALISAKNIIAKNILSKGVKAIAGLNVRMKSIQVGIFKSLIGIKGLELYNPSGFPDKLMVNMPEVYVDYDFGSFLKKKMHFEEIRINLKEFVVVKNKKGKLNLDALKVAQAKKGGETTPKKEEKAEVPELKIDVLNLKIGKVIFKDYSQEGEPGVREFNVNIDERYENITDPYTFARLIVTEALMNTAIGGLTDFDFAPLQKKVSETLKEVTEAATGAADKALAVSEEAKAKAEETVKEEVDKITDMLEKFSPQEEKE